MLPVQVFAIIFSAIFVQSFSGFGFALVAMPLATPVLGLKVSAPLVALLGLTAEVVLLIYFRQALALREMGILILASLPGTVLGITALRTIPEARLLPWLGWVLVFYAAYNLLPFRLPPLRSSLWAWGLGLLAGMLGGAYNTSGPPVILYGHARRWEPARFKGNLQGFFLVNNLFVLTGHLLGRNLTPLVWKTYASLLPVLGLGIVGGLALGRKVDGERFRRLVVILLGVLGGRLILG